MNEERLGAFDQRKRSVGAVRTDGRTLWCVDCASVIGNPVLPRGDRTPARWFATEAFLNPALMTPGVFGNLGRNSLVGPGFQNWDISLLKNFHFTEHRSLQFRAESFNIFNHTNFTGVGTTLRLDAAGNPTGGFGAVNAAGPGRVISLGLKLLF